MGKRKRALKDADEDDEDYEEEKKKTKKKKAPWENVNKEFGKFSSGSDGSGIEDEEELEEMYHEIEDRELMFKSDHEFSCESDNDEDYVEVKRARTRKDKGKADGPETILLCDACDGEFHMYSLRPALMAVPEGDWFCPACNHKKLLSSLTDKLTELDSLLKKTEAERRRKERLAFINKGLSKTLPTAQKKESSQKEANYSSDDESSSDTDSEDEVLLPRRCRTKNPIKYNTEEYDSMMNKALQGDIKYQVKDAPPPAISDESEESEEDESEKASPGKPRAGQGKGKNIDNCSDESEEESEDSDGGAKKPKPIKMNINKMKGGKKKRKRLTNLNASDESGDGDSGSDFKLSDEISEEA